MVELEKGNDCLQDPDKMLELEEQDGKDPDLMVELVKESGNL